MEHPIEVRANARFAQLRKLQAEGPVVPGQHIVPGIWFGVDTARSEMDGVFRSDSEVLLKAAFDVRKPGRWLSLNVALSNADLTDDQVIGIVVDLETPAPVSCRFCIRSGTTETDFRNSFAPEAEVLAPGRRTRVHLLRVGTDEGLRQPAKWRNLMLVFEPTSFEIVLHEMRLFVGSEGLVQPA